MWKDFFYFSKSDRRAVAVLLAVIVTTTFLRFLFFRHADDSGNDEGMTDTVTVSVQERSDTLTSIPESVNRSVDMRPSGKRNDGVKTEYRRRMDMRVIAEVDSDANEVRRPLYGRRDKYPYGTVIDLNVSDTVELKKIPGIGSYYARRIVEYRERLGGYFCVDQLLEIEGLPDSVRNWFSVSDTFMTKRIPVNTASITVLKRHPYMGFYRAREIVTYRERNGRIKNPAQLSLLEEFSGQDIERLEPYLSFE